MNVVKLSLTVPCFNEQDNVITLYDAVKSAFGGKFPYEIIFVNDGSKDDTEKRLRDIYEKKEENVKIVNFSRNFGKDAAIYAGLRSSEGEYTCVIDSDMQQRPETVLEMLAFLEDNPDFDMVAAYQEARIESGIMSVCKHMFYPIVNSLSDVEFYPNASDFRMFRRNVLDAVLAMGESDRFSKGIFSWIGFKTHYMPYTAEKRNAGKSTWNFKKLFKYAVGGIVSFTVKPLKMILPLGLFLLFGGLVWFIASAVMYASGGSSMLMIMSFVTFMTGISVTAAGLAADYTARIYRESLRRPVYIEKSRSEYRKDDMTNNG